MKKGEGMRQGKSVQFGVAGGNRRVWRGALLASAAAGVLFIAAPSPAMAVCTTSGTTVTCEGAVVGPLSYSSPVSELIIRDVTGDITAATSDAVAFSSTGIVTIDSNTGAFSISAAAGRGIYAQSSSGPVSVTSVGDIEANNNAIHAYAGADGAVAVSNTGDLTSSSGRGIYAYANGLGTATVTSVGKIEANGDAIYAYADGDGAVAVSNTGDLTSSSGRGIYAYADGYGPVTVTSVGNIEASREGIYAGSEYSSAITLSSTGNVKSSSRRGLRAYSDGGQVKLTSVGNVEGYDDGIYAYSTDDYGVGPVSVSSTGNVTSIDGRGIYASSTAGAVTVTSAGVVTAKLDGIRAETTSVSSTADVIVNITSGSVTSEEETGVVARNLGSGGVTITGGAAVNANFIGASNSRGIFTYAIAGNIDIDVSGNITSASGMGIYAQHKGVGVPSTVTVTSRGTITAKNYGIRVNAVDAAVSVTNTGSVTSSSGYGISAATSGTGAVSVTSAGNVTADGIGIIAAAISSASTAAVTVNATSGTITANNYGIYAVSSGPGAVTVTSGATITATTGIFAGIYGAGKTAVTNTGTISASDVGIRVISADLAELTVVNSGSVKSSAGSAIFATSIGGSVTVTSAGTVEGSSVGIFATGCGVPAECDGNAADGKVSVAINSGTVTANNGVGVYARSTGSKGSVSVTGGASVTSKGAAATDDAIYTRVTDGNTDINVSGAIVSDNARGIFALQSGLGVGVTLAVASAGTVTAKLDGIHASAQSAAVSVVTTGNLTSSGARGIYATSAFGTVTVSVNSGTVTSMAVSAIEVGGSGNLSVSVGGTATGAAAAGAAGVQFGSGTANGASNSLTVASGGVVNNAGGLSQLAVLGFSGNEAVTNAGTVSGNIDLGTGTNSFANNAGGVFNMGTAINLGAGNVLSNAGTLSPGGNGAVATTALTGTLSQAAGGNIATDINLATGAGDRINVSGAASLAGTVAVDFAGVTTAPQQQFTIISAAGGVTDNGLVAVAEPVALSLSLSYPNANDVVLNVSVDFSVDGLNANQRRLGDNLNGLMGASGMDPMLSALLGINDMGSYKDALNQMSPEAYLQAAMSGVFSAQAFADVLMSCREREGSYVYIAQGQCLWMDAGGGNLSLDKNGDQMDSDQTSWWLGGGGQYAVSDTVHAGLGIRYEHVSQDVGSDAHNDGSWGHVGAALKYTPGPWLLGAALSGGKGWIDTDRDIGIGTVSGQAEGDQDLSYVHGKLRAAYLFDMGQWYAKPILDLDATWMSYGDVSEDGGGGAGLHVDGGNDTVLSATPRLEIGGQMEMENGALVRPYLQAGVAFYGDTGFSIDSNFLEAPGGSPSFTTETEMDSVLADISVGLDVLAVQNLNVRLSYDGLFGSNTTSNAGTFRLEWRL